MGNERSQRRRIAATVGSKRSSEQGARAPADHELLALQRSVGNAAVVELLRRQEQEGAPATEEGGAIGEVVAEGKVEEVQGEPITHHDRVRAGPPAVESTVVTRAVDGDVYGQTNIVMHLQEVDWTVTRVGHDDYELFVNSKLHAWTGWGVNDQGSTDVPPDLGVVTAANWWAISQDLTPIRDGGSWVPPQEAYWSRALAERHEMCHVLEFHGWAREAGVPLVQQYLEGERITLSRRSIADPEREGLRDFVHDLLDRVLTRLRTAYAAWAHAGRDYYDRPTEIAAYQDGKAAYERLAKDVRRRGWQLMYPDDMDVDD